MVGLQSYWQSEYSQSDVETKVDDAKLTFYWSFARHASKDLAVHGCHAAHVNVTSIIAYWLDNEFRGLLVNFVVSETVHGEQLTWNVESRVQTRRRINLRILNNSATFAERLLSMEVRIKC